MSALEALTDAERKRFSSLQALSAMRGVEVRAFTNDRERLEYLITQFSLTAFATSLDDLEKHLRRFGVEREGQAA